MITGGFGMMLDIKSGMMRRWYIRRGDVKRWADNDEPVEQQLTPSKDGTLNTVPKTK